jgi:predicted metal-binding protein
MSDQYHDRFSKASKELSEKSAFICESCNKKYQKKEAEKKDMACCGRSLKELHQEAADS